MALRVRAMEKRAAPRKHVRGLHIKNLTMIDQFKVIAREAELVDASKTGILLRVNRKNLVPEDLRNNLTIDAITGHEVMFNIDEMDLEIDGRVTRTKMVGKGVYEIAVDYTEEAPEYWRECLIDLLPSSEE